MTKREAVIVSAYTGYLIGEFSDFQAYAEEIIGRPIFTQDLTRLEYELKEKSKKDFMGIKIEEVVMVLKQERRLCTVNGETGYFHTWENYSKPLEASPLVGGAPAGVFSKIFGLVEFEDGVRRVDPTKIKFCDEEHGMLSVFNKKESKDENWTDIHEK